MGTFPVRGVVAFEPVSTGACTRHRAFWADCVSTSRGVSPVSGALGLPAAHGTIPGQPTPIKQHNAYKTRTAAVAGGALGSHPAREPKPV
jgi:hypothetical protein